MNYDVIYGVEWMIDPRDWISPEDEKRLWIGDAMARCEVSKEEAEAAWSRLLEMLEERRLEKLKQEL